MLLIEYQAVLCVYEDEAEAAGNPSRQGDKAIGA